MEVKKNFSKIINQENSMGAKPTNNWAVEKWTMKTVKNAQVWSLFPYFPVSGPEKNPYLVTFQPVEFPVKSVIALQFDCSPFHRPIRCRGSKINQALEPLFLSFKGV